MPFDESTFLLVMLGGAIAIAAALPALTGWRVVLAVRCMQASAALLALGFAAWLFAGQPGQAVVSTVGVAALSGAVVLAWQALREGLGERPGGPALYAIAVITPVVHYAGFASGALRVGGAHIGLALQLALVCVALAMPAAHDSRRWRALALAGFATLALACLVRGVHGALYSATQPQAPEWMQFAAGLLVPGGVVLAALGLTVGWREESRRDGKRQVDLDARTGLLNRRAFRQRAQDLVAQAVRYGDRLTLLRLDIDRRKEASDSTLQAFAQTVRICLRQGDLACSEGEEGFSVLLARADRDGAEAFDRRLRGKLKLRGAAEGSSKIGFSAGVAHFGDHGRTLDELTTRADESLGRVRGQGGRGRMDRA